MRFIPLWILFVSSVALADDQFPEFMCVPPTKISPPSEHCEDNAVFVRAAELCLKRLKGEVSREGEVVNRYFSKKEKDRQSQDFHEGSFNHAQASQRLARLIRLAKKTALELDTYFDHVFYPVDYELPEVNGGNVDRYVMSKPCYGETVRSIDSVIRDVVEVGRELNAAKKTADSIAGNLDGREEKINGSLSRKVTGGNAAEGSSTVRVPSGKSSRGESTITGEIHEKKK